MRCEDFEMKILDDPLGEYQELGSQSSTPEPFEFLDVLCRKLDSHSSSTSLKSWCHLRRRTQSASHGPRILRVLRGISAFQQPTVRPDYSMNVRQHVPEFDVPCAMIWSTNLWSTSGPGSACDVLWKLWFDVWCIPFTRLLNTRWFADCACPGTHQQSNWTHLAERANLLCRWCPQKTWTH